MKKSGNAIPITATTFYIIVIILVALSSFFVSMIVANTEIFHSNLICKAVAICAYCNFGDCHGYNRTEDFG